MSHPLRLKILCTITDKEFHVHEINELAGARLRNISRHLAILRENGVLRSRKVANHVYYCVGDSHTLELIRMMRELFCERNL